jgi:hypothetical protein
MVFRARSGIDDKKVTLVNACVNCTPVWGTWVIGVKLLAGETPGEPVVMKGGFKVAGRSFVHALTELEHQLGSAGNV